MPILPSRAFMYSGNVSKSHAIALIADGCICSTLANNREMKSRSRGAVGAIEKPQLPASTVVTPWYDDIVANGSKVICGS